MTKKEEKELEDEVKKWLHNLLAKERAKERKRLVEEIFKRLEEKYSCQVKNLIGQPEVKVIRLDFLGQIKSLFKQDLLAKLKGSRDSTKEKK